jgi:hypothetical protein
MRAFRCIYTVAFTFVPPIENRTCDENGRECAREYTVDENFAIKTNITCDECPKSNRTQENGG